MSTSAALEHGPFDKNLAIKKYNSERKQTRIRNMWNFVSDTLARFEEENHPPNSNWGVSLSVSWFCDILDDAILPTEVKVYPLKREKSEFSVSPFHGILRTSIVESTFESFHSSPDIQATLRNSATFP